ncbi:MAG: TRAP transporter large permease [Alphaproteobacteria bacterium]|jgi:tripartite ATP-independent transporter DctM subunit|nr:TRAP transporter large permease [Alphaproteobacteria bacterium]MBU0806021.1 TRAP transporter large permease [Alphaproteobacteria bacterium]MBU0874010.1 TRAP transporter large permease [Alphaproteobacteria bacterium]MBU1402166.1 TRAP transporter large permease [Alphaproteobacteria bacterium]MBU1590811.1 TRAP transporter large permease [Alphaproteobacteria bacterium]
MSIAVALMLVLFMVTGAIGMPIGFAMIVSGFAYLLITGKDLGLVAAQGINGLFSSFILLAVPLFIFAAEVMTSSSISTRLLNFVVLIVGRVRGGLAYVNIIVSIIFAGMSGSALADAAGPGKLMIDMMTRNNRYPRSFAGALTAASATIGPIIPPSIPMVIYGAISGTSIGALFLAGIIPGLLMGLALAIQTFIVARRRDFPVEDTFTMPEARRATLRAGPALLLPVILLGGIYSGAVTPTEAAAVAALYAIILAIVFRDLTWRSMWQTLLASARGTAIVAITVVGALFFNYVVAGEQIPNMVADWISSMSLSPLAFLLVTALLFLLLGAVFDTLLMLLVMVPILMPSVHALGIDPVHFGVVVIVNMMIGLITPPYGELLFLVGGISKIPLAELIREIWGFILTLLVALLLIILFPELVLLIPQAAGY